MKTKTIVECKSIGVHLTEEVAREIDAVVKTLSKECVYKRKGALPDSQELVKGERADISTISTEHVDRDGEVVLSKGMDTEFFSRNPVVTLSHRYDEAAVARCQWIKKIQGGIRAKTIYPSRPTDWTHGEQWVPDQVFALVQAGLLKGKSIGFLPTRIRSFTQEEITKNPSYKKAERCIESGILLEYAVCALPVNQAALVEAVAKGTIDNAMLRRLGLTMPKKLTEKNIAAIIEREFQKGFASLSQMESDRLRRYEV